MSAGADSGPAQRQEHLVRLRDSRELVARTVTVSTRMRQDAVAQRERLAEQRRRWEELRTGDTRIERLRPHLEPPEDLPVRMRVPAGRAAAVLLCGICDEVLAVGTYAADLRVTLRCCSCLGYNTGARTG